MITTTRGYRPFSDGPVTNHEIDKETGGTLYSRIRYDTDTGMLDLTHERAKYDGRPEREWSGRVFTIAYVPYILSAERADELLAAASDLLTAADDLDAVSARVADLVADYGQLYGRRVRQVGDEYEAEATYEAARSIQRDLAASGTEPTEQRVRELAEAAYAERDSWEYWPSEAEENVAEVTWLVDHDSWMERVLDHVQREAPLSS